MRLDRFRKRRRELALCGCRWLLFDTDESLGAVRLVGGLHLLGNAFVRLLCALADTLTVEDELTYLGVVAVLGLAALVASGIPAFRALRSDPLAALRQE